MSSALERFAARVAREAIELTDIPIGPLDGSMRSKSADQVPLNFATTGSDFVYLPRERDFKRRGGSTQKFDTFGAAAGALPAKWGGKCRHMEQFLSESISDGMPTVCALVTKETIASGLDDGRFSNFWIRDQVNNLNYTVGDEFGSSTYPAPGSIQSHRFVPLWYESGDGGITRGIDEFKRRFLFSGSRRFMKSGNWWYEPAVLGTPSRWRGRFIPSSMVASSLGAFFQRPAADRTDAAWTNQAGSAVDLFSAIDESILDTADYIKEDHGSEGTTLVLDLGTPGGTPTPTMRHRVRITYERHTGGSGTVTDFNWTLKASPGGTTIKAVTDLSSGVASGTVVTGIWDLSASEIALISSYSTMVFEAFVQGAALDSSFRIHMMEIEYGNVSTLQANANRLLPSGPLPPTHMGTLERGTAITADYQRPDATDAAGTWVTFPSGGSLHERVDEATADDSDYIQNATNSSAATLNLSDFTTDPVSGDTVTLRVRARFPGLGARTLLVELLETATVRASASFSIAGPWAEQSLVLTNTELLSVGNWDNMKVRLTLTAGTTTAYVSWVALESLPAAAATADGGWRGKHRFFGGYAYRFEDDSIWMPTIPRFPNSILPAGFGLFTVDANNPEVTYAFVRRANIPQPLYGIRSILILRSEKIDSTSTDNLELNPFKLGVVDEVPVGTRTYDDYFADDDSLKFDPEELQIRFDHMMPPRSRYNFGGAMRSCHMYGGTSPCGILLAPVGRAADYDLNYNDDTTSIYGSGAQYFHVVRDPTGTNGLVLTKTDVVGTTTSETLSFATYDTLEKLVDRINLTVAADAGGQWRAQICPGAPSTASCVTALTPHKRVIQSCVVASQTITKAAGGLGVVAVGTEIAGTGVTAGAYISRIDTDGQLTFVGTITAGTKDLTFFFNTGDTIGSDSWYQRSIANSLPSIVYLSKVFLDTEPVNKQATWMTVASPGSLRSAPNCFSSKIANRHTPPTDAGVGMGGVGVDNGFVLFWKEKRGAIRNTVNEGTGVDEDYHLFITNEDSGCSAWNTVTPGNRCAIALAPEGLIGCDLFNEGLLTPAIYAHAPPITGDFSYELPLSIAASAADTDGAYAAARVLEGSIWMTFRASGSHPNRQLKYDFTTESNVNGLEGLFRGKEAGNFIPYGWSVPIVRATSAACGLTVMVKGVRSDGVHLYGWNEENAGSTGDGRIDEFETGDTDNGAVIGAGATLGHASIDFPWIKGPGGRYISGQEAILEHNAPTGSTGFLDFIRSYSEDIYPLTPSTSSSLVVSRDPKFLPTKGARVGSPACRMRYRQTGGGARTVRKITLRVKILPLVNKGG